MAIALLLPTVFVVDDVMAEI